MPNAYPPAYPAAYPAAYLSGSGATGAPPAADLWEKTLWPNFPATTMASNLRVANVTSSGSGATLSDVTGPNGELGVRVTMGTGTFRLSAPQSGFDIDLTQGNIEIDMRMVSNTGNLGVGSAVSVVVSSGASGGLSDVLATNNNRSVPIESKMRIHTGGSVNMSTICVPNNRIAVVANTGADMTHITGVRIGTNRTANPGAVFDVFGWRYRPNPRISSITPVLFRFDGGSIGQYNVAFPKLKTAFGNTTCKAFVTFGKRFLNTTNFLTDSQFADWLNAGAQFAPHGGYTTDNQPADVAEAYSELSQHRIWAKDYGNTNGFPNIDHWSSFLTWYSNVGASNVNAQTAINTYRLATSAMDYTSATGAPTPMQLGGAAFPPTRWNMEAVSANSWDAANGFALDQDAIDGATAVMDAARANRSYACFTWHAMSAGDRSDIVLDTVISKIAAEPTNFVAMTPAELFDPYLITYGGIE